MATLAKMFYTGLALTFQKPQLAFYVMLVNHDPRNHDHVRSLLLVQCHVCLPTVILPVMMAMDSPSETVSPLNAFFYKLPWSQCFVKVAERYLKLYHVDKTSRVYIFFISSQWRVLFPFTLILTSKNNCDQMY